MAGAKDSNYVDLLKKQKAGEIPADADPNSPEGEVASLYSTEGLNPNLPPVSLTNFALINCTGTLSQDQRRIRSYFLILKDINVRVILVSRIWIPYNVKFIIL